MRNTNILFIIYLFSGIGFSIFPPLFPSICPKYKISKPLIGLIISIFSLPNIFPSSSDNSFTKKFSKNKLLIFATFSEATCILLYGFLPLIKSFNIFISLILITRIVHGIISRIINTSVHSLTISLSNPLEIQQIYGNLEKAWYIGIIIGPIFASIFYILGGCHLPFMALGIFLYLSVFLSTQINKEMNLSNETIQINYHHIVKYLRYREIIIILGAFFYGYIYQSFFYPCLTEYIEKNLNLSESISYLCFGIISLSYYIVLQNIDSFNKKYGFYGAVFIGILMISLGVLMIFWHPLSSKSIIVTFLGIAFIGGGASLIFIPALFILALSIRNVDIYLDDQVSNQITSSLHLFISNFGDFCGPIIGGMISGYLGFKYCCINSSLKL